MQGNAEIHHAMINGTHHIVVPTITKIPIQTLVDAGDRPTEFETGTVASQSYYRGVNFDGHQMLDQHYLSEEASLVRQNSDAYTWDNDRTGFHETDYQALSDSQRLQLLRLHAIKGDVQTHLNTRYYELQQVVADTTDDPFAPVTEEIRARQKQVDAETATLEQLKSVAKLEKAPGAETCGEAEKWLVARILNYYDDHFAGSDGKLDPTVRALFLCETGFKQRGDVAYPIDTSSAFWPDELRLIKSQARIVDAKFLLKQHGKVSYLDTLETMEADIKTSGFTGILLDCKQNQLEQHAKRIGKIMRIRAVEPSGNHSLSDALFALSLYSAKKDLVGVEGDEKATAAANLCNEVCDVLLSRTTDLHSKKQSLVALTSSKRYQCLKTSRTVGRQFLNQLWGKALFFLAAVKWVITGSYHWRTDGASKRKNLEIAVANNSFSVMETIQTNKQPVGVNALAAAA